MHSNLIAAIFGLLSSLSIAWGTVVRHRIAEEAPAATGKTNKAPIFSVITRPLWWAGLMMALLGYVLQIVALGFGTLLVVQPLLVLSLMFTLPMSAIYDGRRISKAETAWSFLLSAAVAVLVLLGRPLPGVVHPPLDRWIPSLVVGIIILGALDRLGHTKPKTEKALILGIVTGGIFGFVAVLSKAVVDIYVHHGAWALITNWELYGLIIGAFLGTAVQQSSFNAGALKHSLPAMTITEPIFAFSLGYLVLGETFQAHGWQWIFMALALIAMIASTIALSRKGVNTT